MNINTIYQHLVLQREMKVTGLCEQGKYDKALPVIPEDVLADNEIITIKKDKNGKCN